MGVVSIINFAQLSELCFHATLLEVCTLQIFHYYYYYYYYRFRDTFLVVNLVNKESESESTNIDPFGNICKGC